MKICFICGAQNLDNSKFCCQCGQSLEREESEKRVFIPMCEEESGFKKLDSTGEKANKETTDAAEQNETDDKNQFEGFSLDKNTTKEEEDDTYSSFKMREREDIFNDEESDVFDSNSVDRNAERKRRRDAEKAIKRAEKKKKRDAKKGITVSDDDGWQNDDFWN